MPQQQGQLPQLPIQPGLKTAMLALPSPASIVVTRPVKELGLAIIGLKLPSWELIGRVIKVLVLGIFRWHLCDRVLLVQNDYDLSSYEGRISLEIYHSMKGKVVLEKASEINKQYPFMLDAAYYLSYKIDNKYVEPSKEDHPDQKVLLHVGETSDTFVRMPVFANYKEISPQTIREFYSNFFGIAITPKKTGNSISDLFNSKLFKLSETPSSLKS